MVNQLLDPKSNYGYHWAALVIIVPGYSIHSYGHILGRTSITWCEGVTKKGRKESVVATRVHDIMSCCTAGMQCSLSCTSRVKG